MRLIVARILTFEAEQPIYGFRIDHTDDADLHIFMMSDQPFNSQLPVELSTFSAKQQELSTALYWETESEINSDYFDIQHSIDGQNFASIGKIKAASFSKEQLSYQFTHQNPAKGDNYYRLKMIDQDDTYEYSKMIHQAVDYPSINVNAFPNPSTNGEITVQLEPQESPNYLRIFNPKGELIYQKQSPNNILHMDLSRYAAGVYLLIVNNDVAAKTHQIILR